MICQTKAGAGFLVSGGAACVSASETHPQCLPGWSPSFVCRSQCSAASPAGWDAVGTVSFPARVDVAETLDLLIPVLIAEETFCFVLWEERKNQPADPCPLTAWREMPAGL